MNRSNSSLVLFEIDSLDESDNVKSVLREIFNTELDVGTNADVKKIKVNRCRESIIRGIRREAP